MRLSQTAFVVVALSACFGHGCARNLPSAQSQKGKTIAPITGATAARSAEELATVKGGPAVGKRDARLQTVALFPGPEQPVGIALSESGRTFLSFPRWGDAVKFTVMELKDGRLVPFPDAATNAFDATNPAEYDPAQHLVSVQAIEFDAQDRLWLLDPGSLNFGPHLLNAPKLWAYDIANGQRVKAITFPNDVALKMTTLNDVRFDLHRGREGTAYITDSGAGGIIVVDLASGQSWRHLDGHPSVLSVPGITLKSEGQPLLMRKPNGEVMSPDLRSDGIALSPDGKTLYYTVVAGRDVFAVDTDSLANRNPDDEPKVWAAVKKIATKPSANDGILCDEQGRIYTTDFEENAIRRVDPASGASELVVQDARLLWPDTLAMHGNTLYVTSNQLARQPNYHHGDDQRQPPYPLFKIELSSDPHNGGLP